MPPCPVGVAAARGDSPNATPVLPGPFHNPKPLHGLRGCPSPAPLMDTPNGGPVEPPEAHHVADVGAIGIYVLSLPRPVVGVTAN